MLTTIVCYIKSGPGLTVGTYKIGYSDTIDKMVERLNYDIVYIENMSLSQI